MSAVIGDEVVGSAKVRAVAFRLEEELAAATLPLDKVKRALARLLWRGGARSVRERDGSQRVASAPCG